ncbi:hypothetical protein D3C81_960830 [compost metagenome]
MRQPCLGARRAGGQGKGQAGEEQQALVPEQHVLGQALEQMQRRAQILQGPGGRCGALDDIGGEFEVVAQARMAQGLGQVIVGGEPAGAMPVQFAHGIGAKPLQPGGKEFAKQRVEAVPGQAVVGIDALDQQVLVFHALDQLAGIGIAGHCLGHGRIETPEDRHSLGELDELGGQVRHHFLAQVGLQVVRAPDQIVQDRPRIGAVFQHDHDQLQARGPAAGQVVDQAQLVRVDLVLAEVLFHESAGFGEVEGQGDALDFDHQVHDAQTRQAQRRRDARGDHQMQVARSMVEQLLDQLVRQRHFDMVIVIEDQIELFRQVLGALDDGGDGGVHRRTAAVFLQKIEFDVDTEAPHGLDQRRAEGGVALVVRRQRNPRDLRTCLQAFLAPLRQQGRLAVARSPGDQRKPAMLHPLQLSEQIGARHMPGADPGWRELG